MRDKLLRWAILPALIAAGFGLGVLVATDQFRIADDSSLEPGSQAANGSSAVDFDPAEDRKAQHSTEPTSGLVNPFAGAAPSGLDNSSSSQQLGGVTRSSPSVADWDSEDLSLLDPADRGTATDNFAEHNDGESSLYEESLATSGADDDSYAEDVEEAEASLEDDLLATEDEPPPDVHTIAGRVLNQAGELLAGIGVTATLNQYHEDGTAMSVTVSPQRTVSDGLGHYAFQGLPDGMYTIATVRTVQHPVTRIWVRAGVDYADLVVATQNDLRLYGTVTDTAYVPMSSVSINAWAPDLIGTQTDGSGWFELFVPLDGSARSFPVRFTRTGYKIREFLLGEKDWQTGSQIALDVTLEPIGVPTDVTGTLRSAAGEPVVGERVTLYCPSELHTYDAVSGNDGSFLLRDVLTSDGCKFQVIPQGPYEAYVQSEVAVTPGLNLAIILQSRAFGGVSGQMVNVAGNSISNLRLSLRSLVSNRTVEITGDSQGRFAAHELPEGEVVFEQRHTPSFAITGVRVSAGEEAQVRLVLDVGSQRIDGRVLDSVGNPVSVANVALHWEHIANGVHSSSRRTTVADAYGVFSFSGVGPGLHSIVVSAPGYKTVWKDHDSIEQAEVVLQLEELAAN